MKEVLYLCFLLFLYSLRPVREAFKALDKTRRRALVLLVLILVGVQVRKTKYETYPFILWAMYSNSRTSMRFYEYEGTRADGTVERFPLVDMVRLDSFSTCPTPGKRLPWRMRNLADDIRDEDEGAERSEMMDLYRRTMRAVYAGYRDLNPSADFESVRVWRLRCKTNKYVDKTSFTRELFGDFDLTPEAP